MLFRSEFGMKYVALLDNREKDGVWDADFDFDCDISERGWILLRANNREEAMQELKERFISNFIIHDDILTKLSLLEVTEEIEIPLASWFTEVEFQKDHEKTLEEENDRKEYERLKNKFES